MPMLLSREDHRADETLRRPIPVPRRPGAPPVTPQPGHQPRRAGCGRPLAGTFFGIDESQRVRCCGPPHSSGIRGQRRYIRPSKVTAVVVRKKPARREAGIATPCGELEDGVATLALATAIGPSATGPRRARRCGPRRWPTRSTTVPAACRRPRRPPRHWSSSSRRGPRCRDP